MKFKVKDVNLATGGKFIAILTQKDAHNLDLKSGDRVLVTKGKQKITCIINTYEGKNSVKEGHLGLFEEVLDRLKVKDKDTVTLALTSKPESVRHIRDKLFGKRLSYKALYHIMRDITNDNLTDIEKTYFVAAGFIRGWNKKEIVDMTRAMVDSGDKIKFAGITLDKHCIGGVPGNRTTMIVIPIIAAAGFIIPKTSSRAITSAAGTADTMECLAKVELEEGKIKEVVKKTNACIIHGGFHNLAPADDKIIDVESPLSIDAEGQLLASVMAKKHSVTANHVLIDIPVGKSTKAHTPQIARRLKFFFESLGKNLGMHVKVILTDGSHPIGNGVGPLLEAQDVMAVLKNDPKAPQDLKKKALLMAAVLLEMTGKYNKRSATKKANEFLSSGKALEKMNQIIKAQGKVKKPKLGSFNHPIKSSKTGHIKQIDNEIIAKIARLAGSPSDKGSGLYLHKMIHNHIKHGDNLYTIYAQNKFKLQTAVEFAKKNKGFEIA